MQLKKTKGFFKYASILTLGVAILAGVGVGIYDSVEEACKKIITENNRVEPNNDIVEFYNNLYKVYN